MLSPYLMTSMEKEEKKFLGKCSERERKKKLKERKIPTRGNCCVWLLNGKSSRFVCISGLEQGGYNFVIQTRSVLHQTRKSFPHCIYIARVFPHTFISAAALVNRASGCQNKYNDRLRIFHSNIEREKGKRGENIILFFPTFTCRNFVRSVLIRLSRLQH